MAETISPSEGDGLGTFFYFSPTVIIIISFFIYYYLFQPNVNGQSGKNGTMRL